MPPEDLSKPAALFDYQIGPNDQLDIFVWRNPELSSRVLVRPDGRVSMPLIEDLVVTRKTPAALGREIESILSKYIQNPVVTVLVSGFSGPYTQQVRIVGEVGRPTVITFRENLTALDAMLAAGGMGQFAAGNRAVITRITDKGFVSLRVKLDDLLKDGDMTANVRLMPGDTIFVPQSFF
jgi:polysaccharide export outer membrane protein